MTRCSRRFLEKKVRHQRFAGAHGIRIQVFNAFFRENFCLGEERERTAAWAGRVLSYDK